MRRLLLATVILILMAQPSFAGGPRDPHEYPVKTKTDAQLTAQTDTRLWTVTPPATKIALMGCTMSSESQQVFDIENQNADIIAPVIVTTGGAVVFSTGSNVPLYSSGPSIDWTTTAIGGTTGGRRSITCWGYEY